MADLILPRELTPELHEILSMMPWDTGKIARAFRAAGRTEIKPRAEDEQAFVLHWLLTLVLEHGADWRRHAGEALAIVIAEAKAGAASDSSPPAHEPRHG